MNDFYKEILEKFPDDYVLSNPRYNALGFKKGGPTSITSDEFEYFHNYVLENNIKNVYEVATGTGLSTLSFSINAEHVITIDSYIEAEFKSCDKYRYSKGVYKESFCFDIINNVLKHFNVIDKVDLNIGWSPDDVPSVVNNKIFDLVFIDALHFDEALIKDFDAIWPYVNKDKYTIFLHDTHCFKNGAIQHISKILNTDLQMVKGINTYNLGYFTNEK